MKLSSKSHIDVGNVLFVPRFQQTLFGTQTNPNKSQRKLKIDPTLGYHILNASMPCCFIFQVVVFFNRGSSYPLCLFNVLSPIAYGNKVMVVRCAKLATPHVNKLCCLLLKTLNAKSKCICKARSSTVMALRSKNTLSMTSITSSSIVNSGWYLSSMLIFWPGCSSMGSSC